MNEIEDFYKDVPEAIKPTIVLGKANESIHVYHGDFIIQQNGKQLTVVGDIDFHWFPDMRTSFSGQVTPYEDSDYVNIDHFQDVSIIINNLIFGIGRVNNRVINSSENLYTLKGNCHDATFGDKTLVVNKILFSIPNHRNFFGAIIKTTHEKSIQGEDGRIYFEDEKYSIIIDKINNFQKHQDELSFKGGFTILYGGKISKKKGSIGLEEFKQIHFKLSNFLFFLNGRRTAPLFMQGIFEEEVLWTDYTPYKVDQFKQVLSWTQNVWFSDLSNIWQRFSALWKDEGNQDFLNSLLHWYVEANSNAAYIEGSIILAQTALELVYNWLIIEQRKLIIGNDAENLSASNKIRLILSELKIEPAIPEKYVELLEFSQTANAEISDAPESLTRVRNALIHGQEKKRRDLIKMNPQAKYQAVQIALWYIELATLKILNYTGKYCNRITGYTEVVPWNLNDNIFKDGD